MSVGNAKSNVICFHRLDEENAYLSNWYPASFIIGENRFYSVEQYMMYRKAVCFGDQPIAEKILRTRDPAEIKKLGRQVSGYLENYWNGFRQLIVYEGLMQKFSQNPDLQSKLLGTGTALLAECAERDKVWGIGLSMTNPDRLMPEKWNGQNLLGYALMAVRDKLKG